MKIGNIVLDSGISLAPMAGYGDVAFRRMCLDCGAGLTTTEMVSAKGLCYDNEKTVDLLRVAPNERVRCVQLFGADVSSMAQASAHPALKDFDIIDINMGCPVGKIVRNGEGSALMGNMQLASKIITAVVRASGKLTTVKFRLGTTSESINFEDFAKMCEASGASAITVHARTAEQMYSGKADWSMLEKVRSAVSIPCFGNGDVVSAEDIARMLSITEGVAIGRGAIGNPEIFALKNEPTNLKQTMLKHMDYMLEYFPEYVAVRDLRKHLPYYLKGVRGAKPLKQALNQITSVQEYKERIDQISASSKLTQN